MYVSIILKKINRNASYIDKELISSSPRNKHHSIFYKKSKMCFYLLLSPAAAFCLHQELFISYVMDQQKKNGESDIRRREKNESDPILYKMTWKI